MTEDTTGGGAMWALVTVLLVIVVLAILFFGGFLGKVEKKSADMNLYKPSAVSQTEQSLSRN